MERVEAMLHDLADGIRSSAARIASLERLATQLESEPECFTPEECAAARKCIDDETRAREAKLSLLREKVTIYETSLLQLDKCLATRKQILDGNPESLEQAPELLHVLVERHASLASQLDSARDFLLSE